MRIVEVEKTSVKVMVSEKNEQRHKKQRRKEKGKCFRKRKKKEAPKEKGRETKKRKRGSKNRGG